MTLLVERMTESAVAERLAACRPWVRALLPRLLGRPVLDAWPPQRRFLVIDGSGVHAPGARGTQDRLHLCLALVTLPCTSVAMTDQHTGERLRPLPLGPGEVAVADRGDGHPATIVQTVQRGADGVRRRNPHNVPVTHRDGTPMAWHAVLGRPPAAPVSPLPVPLAVAGAAPVRRWGHAAPRPEANQARRVCRQQSRQRGHQPAPQTLFLAGWGLVVTTLPPTLLAGPTALALDRVRWPIDIAIKRWTSVLAVDWLRARSESPLADVWWQGQLRSVL
jgi:hypothetical protein